MKKRKVLSVAITLFIITSFSFSKKKTKILIIGDSISIGYTPFVKNELSDIAIIFHTPGNAQHTKTGLAKIEEWVNSDDWDIIQINWGLWDLCYRQPHPDGRGKGDKIHGKLTTSLDEYGKNLDILIKRIKKLTKAKLIFVTTSYVPPNEPGRYKEDVQKYNSRAKKTMKKNRVQVNDIYKASRSIHEKYRKGPADVHYSKEGYGKFSELIVPVLAAEIKNNTIN